MRFIVPLLIVWFLASVALISLTTSRESKQLTQDRVRVTLDTVLDTSRQLLQLHLDGHLQALHELSSAQALNDIIVKAASTADDNRHFQQFISQFTTSMSARSFALVAADGDIIASLEQDPSDRRALTHLQQHHAIHLSRAFEGESLIIPSFRIDNASDYGNNNTEEPNSAPVLYLASPVYRSDNHRQQIPGTAAKVHAVLLARINTLGPFSRLLQLSRIGASGEVYAFDKQGFFVSASRFFEQLQGVGLVNQDKEAILSLRVGDPGKNLLKTKSTQALKNPQQPLTLMAQSATQGQRDANTQGYRDYRGVEVVGVWLWDDELGMGLAAEMDATEALEPYFSTRYALISISATTTLMALLLLEIILYLKRKASRTAANAREKLEQEVEQRTAELMQVKQELETANQHLLETASTDSLTGLANRRHYDSHISYSWEHCQRNKLPLSLLVLDVDYFKYYNDHYGHQQGDACLERIADSLKQLSCAKRATDLVARYGGEEFVIVLSGADGKHAMRTAQEVQQAIAALAIPHQQTPDPDKTIVSVSIGIITELPPIHMTPAGLFKGADQALYQAKANGRNCIFVAE